MARVGRARALRALGADPADPSLLFSFVPHLGQEPALNQVGHPLRRRLPLRQRQLDLEHRVGKARDLRARHRECGVAKPAPRFRAGGAVVRVFFEHDEVGVQGDAHGGVERDLKRSAPVLGAQHRGELLGVDLGVDLFGLERGEGVGG
jgi:hypothetical protein